MYKFQVKFNNKYPNSNNNNNNSNQFNKKKVKKWLLQNSFMIFVN